MRGKRTDQKIIDAALERNRAGESIEDIAKEFGLHPQSVYKWKRDAKKVKTPQKEKRMPTGVKFNAEQITDALKRLASGEKAEVICKELGINISTLHRWRAKGQKVLKAEGPAKKKARTSSKRFLPSEIEQALRAIASGKSPTEVAVETGTSVATIYQWKNRHRRQLAEYMDPDKVKTPVAAPPVTIDNGTIESGQDRLATVSYHEARYTRLADENTLLREVVVSQALQIARMEKPF